MRKNRAFTLLELVVLIIIVALLGFIGYYSVLSVFSLKVHQQNRKIIIEQPLKEERVVVRAQGEFKDSETWEYQWVVLYDNKTHQEILVIRCSSTGITSLNLGFAP
jgi:Tfp pilus assembly protein PilE